MSERAAPAATGGRDYWDVVLAEMRRRPSVRISLVLLVLLYAVAIYAPFLAGDRPLFIAGTDAAGYRRAQNTLRFAANDWRTLLAGASGIAPPPDSNSSAFSSFKLRRLATRSG